MYDWANSAYSLVITSALFPIYFHAITTEGGGNTVRFLGRTFNSDSLQTYALSAAFLIIAFINPLLSSIADYSGRKKRFMYFFCTLGSLACASSISSTPSRSCGSVSWDRSLRRSGTRAVSFLQRLFTGDRGTPRPGPRECEGLCTGIHRQFLLLIFSLSMVLFPDAYGGIEKEPLSGWLFSWWVSGGSALPKSLLPITRQRLWKTQQRALSVQRLSGITKSMERITTYGPATYISDLFFFL